MKTLALQGGDLLIGPGGHVVVEGTPRVVQQISNALREEFGIDRFHRRWGSLLQTYIGLPADERMQTLVRSEATRIVQNFIAVQNDLADRDRLAGRRPRFSTAELIKDITEVRVAPNPDRPDQYDLLVAIEMFSGEQFRAATTVEA